MKDTLNLPWDSSVAVPFRTLSIGPGWLPLVRVLDRDLREIWPDYRVTQVKEKFGELRFYADAPPLTNDSPVSEAFHARIREAERLSVGICEECGQPGRNREVRHWWRTLCDKHQAEREAAVL